MELSRQDKPIESIRVRTYRESDQSAVRRLYRDGRFTGQVPLDDTAEDIECIEEVYLAEDRGHFWVAECDGEVVGMVGLVEDKPHRAQIRRLRVDPSFRDHGTAFKLMQMALECSRDHGYLKVVLDTAFEGGCAIEFFDRFAFQHHRTRTVGGKEIVEFYLDLYREPKPEDAE